MPYAYADDIAIADLAFRAWGQTVEETFIAAAEATMHAMVEDLATIAPREQRTFELHDEQLDLLLWQFLQELLFYKDAQRLLLRVSEMQITGRDHGFSLQARAAGEPLDPARHALGADVKGVTLHRLQVVQSPNGWEATVVLDV
jgi:SHS2 domain-containing protein